VSITVSNSGDATATSSETIDFHVDAPTALSVYEYDIFPTPFEAAFIFSAELFQGASLIESFSPSLPDETAPVNLAVGDYTLKLFHSISMNVNGGEFDFDTAAYSFNVNFNGANPIPLPPAAWSGMLAMGLSCVGPLRRRFCR
jgi:hypothetical protein